jgi:phosphatidate cytidylyltransferase
MAFCWVGVLGSFATLILQSAPHGDGIGLLYGAVLCTVAHDVGSFAAGRLLGSHPLMPEVSPNKTWEGALGAVTFSVALAYALWFSFPAFSAGEVALTGLIVGIGGQLGDLTISVVKRDIGVKDLGATIPGHGGLLDRIDSLIFVAPLFLHMVKYSNGL